MGTSQVSVHGNNPGRAIGVCRILRRHRQEAESGGDIRKTSQVATSTASDRTTRPSTRHNTATPLKGRTETSVRNRVKLQGHTVIRAQSHRADSLPRNPRRRLNSSQLIGRHPPDPIWPTGDLKIRCASNCTDSCFDLPSGGFEPGVDRLPLTRVDPDW